MNQISFISFALAIFILAASPGPGVFATISRALASGLRRALYLISGIVIGDLLYLMLAIFGLSMVARVLGDLFVLVRICGGLYLVWLGIKIWTANPVCPQTPPAKGNDRKTTDMVSGLIITLSNPKVIFFYCGFLPTFMDMNRLSATHIILVAGVAGGMVAAVLALYAFLADRSRHHFRNYKISRIINRVAGGGMITTGVAIAAKP